MNTVWNADNVERLRSLTGEGLSASQIGAQLGVSRNAVIGKLLRLKGAAGRLTPKPAHRGGGRPRTQPLSEARIAVKKAPPVAPVAPVITAERLPVIAADHALTVPPMPFLDAVLGNRCLHFIGDPYSPGGPDMPVCGCERSSRSLETRYCPRHLTSQREVRV